ncbi:putative O-methyltransferase YrrM [Leeuwenhoekiella aestuarii]|uniref:Putative O-methyltransferase YrrM n=1 Tax=Leeuwenhoekiella aestuarii TaxID=2249426 RepID=A0A4Q0NR74_9FLAO|nr:class I SAM-dependent methyltransferase [Leeuwenhoekiella aestuarii]RXG12363.1 putative O-methyltransferase YrrM [Leeuwenhoekiella aestuarii]RXG13795.1 putative O-methyltransferase YrrM [Leeuwenhoekiella aestuarii]
MWYLIKEYLKFLKTATNQHGVHSPFIFSFVTKCLYDRKKYTDYKPLQNYRNELLKSDEVIEVTDFGAGSRVFKSNKRKVKAIAQFAGASFKRMQLLYRVVSYFKPKSILEIGTSLGLATSALALSKTGKLTTLEGCPETSEIARKHLVQSHISNVEIIKGDFRETLLQVEQNEYDLIYFDGNHSKMATLEYFEQLLPTAQNDSVWVFDDIYWSASMTEAWETIKQHPQVQVTVDCFWLGFVFFRQEQAKEHFKIRL